MEPISRSPSSSDLSAIKIAIVGCGEIFRSQHLNAIQAGYSGGIRFKLVATVDPNTNPNVPNVPHFPNIASLLATHLAQAVMVCTPSRHHFAIAKAAIEAGRHVILEKPPTSSIEELEQLAQIADREKIVLVTLWHSQHAAAVVHARHFLKGINPSPLKHIRIIRREDFYKFHPGQDWVFTKSGGGIFDPLVNALSIVKKVTDMAPNLIGGHGQIPSGREAAISGQYDFVLNCDGGGVIPVHADAGWTTAGQSEWTITFETMDRTITLFDGGAEFAIDEAQVHIPFINEYVMGYQHIGNRILLGRSEVIPGPLLALARSKDPNLVSFTAVPAFDTRPPGDRASNQ